MKKLILIFILVGDLLTYGYFDAPTGERVFWAWLDNVLFVADTNKNCLYNDNGLPRECISEEEKMVFNLFDIN